MIRILIVEDELPIANLIRLSLSKAGYTCDCVYDGAAAARPDRRPELRPHLAGRDAAGGGRVHLIRIYPTL